MVKLLLIQANSPMDTLIPPNISTMSSFLKLHGVNVQLFDTTFYKTREETGDDVRVRTLQVKETKFSDLGIKYNNSDIVEDFVTKYGMFKPNLVGLSAVSLTYQQGLQLLNSIMSEPVLKIVGGTHATICPEEVIAEPAVDMVCIGEGELALLELCNAIRDEKEYTKIENLWVKRDGKVYKNPIRPSIDINKLPFQDWTIFDERRHYKPMGGKIRRTCCIELNRGCPFNCTYCMNEFLHKMYHHKNYRERKISNFIAEVKYLYETYNIEYIYMAAESFLVTKKERFLEFIENYKEFKIPFWMETRPESVIDEKIKLLKEVGCESMNIGIECGDAEFRSEVLNRRMSNKQIVNAVHTIKKHEIRIGVNNIIGFPHETREQIFKTIELNREADADSIMIHPFNPYHGTKLYDVCVESGYIQPGMRGGDYRIDYFLEQPQLSKDDVMGLYRTFAMYVKFPKDRWNEIKKAEKNDIIFKKLSKEYKEKYLA